MTTLTLSPHFSIEELTASETAARRGLDNTPPEFVVPNLSRLCFVALEPIRSLLGVPIHVNSGFRTPMVNLLVGGSMHSAHMEGRAADIVPAMLDLREAFEKVRRSKIEFDQCILEAGAWLHIAISRAGEEPRREALIGTRSHGVWVYTEVR